MTSLDNFRKQCVLIVGDLMVDRYIIGTVDRISPEAPIPVLLQQQITRKLGGMGNVVLNVASLSAKVRVVGRVGSDEEGRYLRDTLKENGVDDSYVFSEGKTIVKTRVAASNQQFLRIDEETILPPSREIVEALQSGIDRMMKDITVVIISDYAKGFVTEEVAQIIIGGARRAGIPVLVDPKGKSAAKYRGATAMTPNTKEFKDMAGLSALPDEEGIRAAAAKLCLENDLKYLIYTRSEKGISTIYGKTGEKQDYPAVEKEVVDVTGAGDTVVSVLALSMASGFELRRCVKMANVAASIVISRFGAAQTTIEELDGELHPSRKKVMDPQRMIQTIHQLQQGGKHIVFTNGCFDLVHAGHISSFRQARSFGDVLVVGVNSDDSIRRIKGPTRPIVSLENRMALLNELTCVDFVIPFEEDTPQRLIEEIHPDVLVKGKDWEGKKISGDDFVMSYGGKVRFIDLEQGLSTTSIIEKIKAAVK